MASTTGRAGPGTPEILSQGAAPSRRARVLMVGNFFRFLGRNSQYCRDFAEQLARRGHLVMTVSHRRSRILRLVAMTFFPWWQRRRFDVAVVDVFSGPSFLWAEAATMALDAARKPVALTLRGGALPAFAHRHPRRVRKLLCRAAEVTAPSSYLAEAMKPFRSDIKVIPNALELSRYPFRHRSGVKPNLIWLRAFHRMYAPEVAIQVLASLLQEHPEAHLTMVGPDKDGSLAHCQALAVDKGVASRVTFLTAVPKEQVPAVLAQADIFLNTTTVDNTPVSVIEAMACGLCVVSTNAGGVPHLVRDGEEGILVPVGDAGAMVEAVTRLLDAPSLAARLSANARAKAAGFDWSNVLPQWEELLETLVACANRGGS